MSDMYSKYKDFINEYSNNDEKYNDFLTSIKSGTSQFSLYQRYLDHIIDIRWVEMIERTIIPLDNIIRNPQRFIQNLEEIVPIEQARKITNESIRHLAQHTNMIAKVDNRGSVTPNKILNVFKEETFATYENRFIYTLLHNLQYFIDKRLKILYDTKMESEYRLKLKNEFRFGKEQITYELNLTSKELIEKNKEQIRLDEDTSSLSIMQRVERLRRILYDFQSSSLIKSLAGTALIRPPIVKTNVILKNPNFKKAVELWQFIERYNEAGLTVKVVEKEELPNSNYMNDLFVAEFINYLVFDNYHKPNKDLYNYEPEVKEFEPELIERVLDDYLNDFSIDIDRVERIFLDKIKKASEEHKKNEDKVKKALSRVIKREKSIETKELKKKKEAEAKQKAKLKEIEEARKAKEKAKLIEIEEARKAKEKAEAEELLEKKKQEAAIQRATAKEKQEKLKAKSKKTRLPIK
jgi:hypothetical protein